MLKIAQNIIQTIDNAIININYQERKFLIKFVHVFHWLITDVFLFTYILLAPAYYDFYMILLLAGQSIHWTIFEDECIINYIEKKIINVKYVLGDNIGYSPGDDYIYNNNELLINFKLIWLPLILFIILFYRNRNKKIIYLLTLIFIILVYSQTRKYNDKKRKTK